MALVDIVNNAFGKIGGAGDQVSGEAFVTAAQLAANDDKVSIWVNAKYDSIRPKVISDFAAMRCPFIETLKHADLGKDLKQYDIAIASIAVASTLVTITTDEAHGRPIGANSDTVYLTGIEQDDDEDVDDVEQELITSLNGNTETIIVTTTTAFTIATAGVDATWVHEADTGIVSYCPEIGPWQYAFKLPSDYFVMVRQCDETGTTARGVAREYQHKPILNRDGDGYLLLTNTLSNLGGDGAYIDYCIDQEDFTMFSSAFEECIATLLAAELCTLFRNFERRQELLVEYVKYTVPDAKRFNQSQYNNRTKTIPNFSGGRSVVRGVPSRVTSDLGTYVTATGTRRKV